MVLYEDSEAVLNHYSFRMTIFQETVGRNTYRISVELLTTDLALLGQCFKQDTWLF